MPKGSPIRYVIFSAAIFILLEIAALALLKRSSTLQDNWINRSSHYVMGKLWGGAEALRGHFRTLKQNEELRDEVFRLQEELEVCRHAAGMMAESSHAVSTPQPFRIVPATVVKMTRGTAHNCIILNKGKADGVIPYSGIIAQKGVVGIVSAVGEHYCYGLTLMNPNISVSSRVGADEAVGPLVWDGRHPDGAKLKDLPLHFSVREGDTVRTSGFSTIFPADIPLGVTGAHTVVDGSTKVFDVTLFQDFSSLRYVTIAVNTARNEILELEEGAGI